MKPSVFTQIDAGLKSGKTAFVLEWNTNDRVTYKEEGIPPSALHLGLASYLARRGYHIGLYSQGNGLQQLVPPGSAASGSNPFQQAANQSLNLVTPILRRRDAKVAIVIQYADLLAVASDGSVYLQPEQQVLLETLHRWGADDAIRQAGNIVVLISYEGGVNSLLTRSGVYNVIQVPLPDQATRQEFIDLLLAGKFGILESDFGAAELARVSNGLRLVDLESLFRLKGDSCVTRADVQAMKSQTIREMAAGLVEVVQPSEGFESVAGLRAVKEFFIRVKWMFQNASPAVVARMILAGVPGVGKSKIISSLAKELDLPLLIIRNLHGPYVGQSEANLERVLHTVDSMSPCVVVIEEGDQGIGQRGVGPSGDSGTTNRMSQRLWEELGSNKMRGKNLWILTSNRPDLLDPAMLDRFQVVIPFLHPTPNEVAELLPSLAHQIGREFGGLIDLGAIARLPQLYLPTVRGLVEIVTVAAQRADFEKGKVGTPIEQKHLLAAAQDYKCTYDRLLHEYIALKCVEMVAFCSLLPWMSFEGRRPEAEIPDYLQDIVETASGRVDPAKLSNRLRGLEQELFQHRAMR